MNKRTVSFRRDQRTPSVTVGLQTNVHNAQTALRQVRTMWLKFLEAQEMRIIEQQGKREEDDE